MTADSLHVLDFRFSHRLRVRWSEVDMQKIVFNGHYLMYFDSAVAEYWRALALPYEDAMHKLGGDLYVARATVEYKASAKYDDRLNVAMKCARIGTSSMTFEGAIFADGKLLVTGELIYVYADPATQKSKPVPDLLRAIMLGFEAGEAMTRTAVNDWQALQADALPLRTDVFVQEQGVPLALEHDEFDKDAVHVVIYNRMDAPVATARLIQQSVGVSRIGRMAVKRVLRGSALGAQALQAMLGVASSRGDHTAVLHAQISAKDFYTKFGFVQEGAEYEEAGIRHVTMTKQLTA